MRCLALANVLSDAGWGCIFAFQPGTLEAVPRLEHERHELFEFGCLPQEEWQFLRQRWPDGCDFLVVDHYDLDREVENSYRVWAKSILVIDDLANRRHSCHFLLDQTLGRTKQTYAGLVPENCTFLLGPEYALLRSEFLELRSAVLSRREKGGAVERILLAFGTMDGKNLCCRTLDAIGNIGVEIVVDIAIGSAAPNLEEVERTAKKCSFPVTLHKDTTKMARLMAAADLCVGAGGMTAWERCCLGLPALLVLTAENQQQVGMALQDNNAVRVVGWHDEVTSDHLAEELKSVLTKPALLHSMSQSAAAICDGRGSMRVLLELLPSQKVVNDKNVRLRLAMISDSDTIYRWQSDKRVRRFFRNPDIPKDVEHEKWIRATMADPDRILSIILYEGEPAGVLRLDRRTDTEEYEVSILVSPDKHGLGIGKAALTFARQTFPSHVLFAEVMPENVASQALFRSAGFQQVQENVFMSGAMI